MLYDTMCVTTTYCVSMCLPTVRSPDVVFIDELFLQYVLPFFVLLTALVCPHILPSQTALTLRTTHIAYRVQPGGQHTVLVRTTPYIDNILEQVASPVLSLERFRHELVMQSKVGAT